MSKRALTFGTIVLSPVAGAPPAIGSDGSWSNPYPLLRSLYRAVTTK